MPERIIRHSTSADLPRMLEIYEYARALMRATGNPTQWVTNPRMELLEQDIAEKRSYIIEEKGRVIGTFAFLFGEDPTYRVIEGKWLNDAPYGTIHRIASAKGEKGILRTVTDWALGQIDNVRIDTHPDNAIMLHLLPKNGYIRCGTIYIRDDTSDHSARYAFQQIKGGSDA